MVPLYQARVEDLHDGFRVGCRCLNCNHLSDVAVEAIKEKLPPYIMVKDIERKFRCEKCGMRGDVHLDLVPALRG